MSDLHGVSGLDAGDTRAHGGLDLLEGTNLNLAYTFARDAKLVGQLLECDRIIDEATRLEDAPLTIVQHAEGLTQRLGAVAALLGLGQTRA